jgi:hypothetical protein
MTPSGPFSREKLQIFPIQEYLPPKSDGSWLRFTVPSLVHIRRVPPRETRGSLLVLIGANPSRHRWFSRVQQGKARATGSAEEKCTWRANLGTQPQFHEPNRQKTQENSPHYFLKTSTHPQQPNPHFVISTNPTPISNPRPPRGGGGGGGGGCVGGGGGGGGGGGLVGIREVVGGGNE